MFDDDEPIKFGVYGWKCVFLWFNMMYSQYLFQIDSIFCTQHTIFICKIFRWIWNQTFFSDNCLLRVTKRKKLMKNRDFLVKWKLDACMYSALTFEKMVGIWKIEIIFEEEMISNKYHIKSVYVKPVLAIKMGIFSKSQFQVKEKNFQNFGITW